MRFLPPRVKKAMWLLLFSLLMMPLLIQFFEGGSFRACASDSSYQLMINDVDNYVVPDTPDINISTVEVDDDELYVYFRLNVTGSVNTTHWYGIDLDYDQDGVEDHTVQLYNGEFEWDWSIQLINSSFSGSSIVWIVPKWLETDSNFAMQAFAYNRLTWSSDYAPGDVGEWSSPYVWQVGEGIVEPYLTGVYSDYGLDLDVDGTFEYLAIDVEINATVAGNYSVTVDGLTNSTHEIPVWNKTDSGYLTEGVHRITVLLSGPNIFSSRINGPYTLDQVVLECYPYSDVEDSPYTTAFYDYRQFAAPTAYLTGAYSDYGLDLDSDGKFEYLVFTIEMNVTVGGTYRVGLMDLLDSLGNHIQVTKSITWELEPGVQNVSVYIYGPTLFSSGANGPYIISYLYLRDSAFNLLDQRDEPYETVNAYSYADFEEPMSAHDLAVAMDIDPADLISATFSVDKIAGAVATGSIGFLAPTEGDTFVMMSSGNAQPANFHLYDGWIGTPDDFLSVDNENPSGTGPLGGEANDLATLNLTLRAPDWAKSLSFNMRFMSEEYPEFVGSEYNDFFSCLLDGTNIAFDTEGNIINVNNNFFDPTLVPEGTVFDGATILLTSKAPVTGGETFEANFIIGDISDSVWDTAVFLDNFRFSTEEVEEPITVPTIWSSDSLGNEKNTFTPTEAVYATVPATGEEVTFYIVTDQNVWSDGDPLTAVSDGAKQLTLDPGPGIQVVQVWGPPLTSGSYDIVEDTNNNGVYDAGADGIDSIAEVGFAVETQVNNPPYQPQLSITPSLVVEDDDDLTVTVIGPTPADPDGDTVTYTYSWFVDVGTGEFLDDELAGREDHTGNKVPAVDTAVGDIWRVEVTPLDEHGAVGPNATATWQQVALDAIKPTAKAGPDQTINEDTLVTFDGSDSSATTEIVDYTWAFTDVTPRTLSGMNPTYNFTTPGVYIVTLNVTDAAGNWNTDTVMITVNDVTQPTADVSIDQKADEDNVVSFDAGDSSDNVGIVTYEWDFGDGTSETGPTTNHIYTEPGSYNVTLTVWDAAGNEATRFITIFVLHAEVERDELLREPRSVYIVAEVAVVGAVVTAATAVLVSLGGLGQAFNSAVSKLPIPDRLKEFLQLYGEAVFETVDKAKFEALEKAAFITRGDLAAFGISVIILTIVFGFVEANGLPSFLDPSVLVAVIPSTLLSVTIVSISEELIEALCARTCRVCRQYRLWLYGLGAFLISGLLFLFPFASPGITRYQCSEISDKTKGLIVLSKMLVLLTLMIPFAGLFMLGYKIIGDAGLLLTLMTVCYSLVPLKPLAGKAVFDYRKEVSLIALVSVAILFYSWTVNLLPHVTYLAAGTVSVVLAAIAMSQLRNAHPK